MRNLHGISERAALLRWMEAARQSDATTVTPSKLCDSTAWSLRDRAIRHRSDRFFSVVGLRWDSDGKPKQGLFIEQREIGILGFVARSTPGGLEILVHAKAEPGNVGDIQLAPTFQATQSNSDRVHGGSLPPFAEYFLSQEGDVVCDSLQSEHGTRFLGKLNRNLFIVDAEFEAQGDYHRWIPATLLCGLMTTDFTVNTDARSVLFCTDWRLLVEDAPFSGSGSFTRELSASFATAPRAEMLQEVSVRLNALRDLQYSAELQDVSRLKDYVFDPRSSTTMANGANSLKHVTVTSQSREVSVWDQPILSSGSEDLVALHCGRNERGLVFGFCPEWEPGLLRGAELAPTSIAPLAGPLVHGVRACVRQSDEGGKFFRDVATYAIIDVGEARNDDFIWLTLSEIDALKNHGVFNNEARSVASLILNFL